MYDYEKKSSSDYTQSFDNFRKIYKLDKETNLLIDTGDTIDIQEQLNSVRTDLLISHLERFFNSTGELPDFTDDTSGLFYDIPSDSPAWMHNLNIDRNVDLALDYFDYVADLRNLYSIPDSVTDFQISDYLSKLKPVSQAPASEAPAHPAPASEAPAHPAPASEAPVPSDVLN